MLSAANKTALLVVHMPENLDAFYHQGTYDEGVQRVQQVVQTAAKQDHPIFFSEFTKGNTDSRLHMVLSGRRPYFYRINAFYKYFEKPIPHKQIKELGVNRLVIVGFNRIGCALRAMEVAISTGLTFATSDDLLFGNKHDFQPDIDGALLYMRTEGTLYPNFNELIKNEFMR